VTPSADRLVEFLEVMRQLRTECSWKREQTHRSLARYLLEETYEALEAIDTGDVEHLREELGDLLLQVYFHAVIAEENEEFTLADVAGDIIDKMRRRNPHVFAPPGERRAEAGDAASVNEVWESIKATEKARGSVLDGLPPGLPALLYADKVLDRLERAHGGPDALSGARGSTNEEGDIGERLLALVAEAREAGVDPEQALRDAVRRLL
jgi:XTP/dITP diphosphohydrolase